MDRPVTYFGQVPRSLDVLTVGQDAMVGLAKLSEAALGTSSAVAGFACTGTTPASLNVVVGPGQVYQVANLEATTVSGLQVDTHQILKQGINLDPTTLTLVPPTTVGFAVNILIEARYADVDTGGIVLTFQNPSVPGQTFQGPGGNGQQSNTFRKGIATVQPNYGTPATSGQQTTPVPDAGFVGIAVVTLAYGQTAITSTNIAPYSGNANYIPTTLTGVPAGVLSGTWTFGTASGTNAYAATLFSTAAYPFAFTTGMEILVYFANANTTTTPTFSANGTGPKAIVRQGGGAPAVGDVSGWVPFVYDSANWRINSLVASDILALIFANGIVGRTQIFIASGTFTVPANVTQVEVEIVGGGGPGGPSSDGSGSGNSAGTAGGGGGAGGYAYRRISGLTAGLAIAVTVGAGGAAVTTVNVPGPAGGTSSFGSYAYSTGGGAGPSGLNAYGVGGPGGQGNGGDLNIAGQSGGAGGPPPTYSANLPLYTWNKGGIPARGFGTFPSYGTATGGSGYGPGGSGASGGSAIAGAAGNSGLIIVRW